MQAHGRETAFSGTNPAVESPDGGIATGYSQTVFARHLGRFAILLFLGLVVPLLLATWYSLHLQRKALNDAYRFEMANMADVLADGMRDPIWNLSPDSGDDLIASVMDDPRVIRVSVTSRAQSEFLSSERDTDAGLDLVTLNRPVRRDGRDIGHVMLVVDASDGSRTDWAAWRRIAFVGGLQLLLSVGVVVFVALLARRLERNDLLRRTNAELQAEIDERQRAETALRESEERLSLTIGASGDGIWDWNIETGELFCSDRLLEMIGASRESFRPHINAFWERLSDQDRDRVSKTLDAHLHEGAPYDTRFRLNHGDGRLIDVAAKGQVARDASGEPIRMVGTISDISELLKSNDMLLQTERMAKIGHWHIELPERRLVWSAGTYRIKGYTPFAFDPTMESAIACYHPEDREAVQRAILAAIETGAPTKLDARIQRPSGEIRDVHCDAELSRSDTGEPLTLIGTIQDRTEQVAQERQLTQSQKMEAFGQLSGGVAHDFNNLLAVIMGNIELLQDVDDPAERIELANAALDAVVRGRDLTSSLLNFARKAPLQPRRVELAGLLSGLETIIRRTLPATQTVRISLPDDIWPVKADPTTLESCILNLALNARDAMSDGGTLTISARTLCIDRDAPEIAGGLSAGSYVELVVADTGCGIPEQDLERVFEPFYSTKPVGKGTGLGLSRVRGFAEQSGGAALLESQLEIGTRVRLVLPAAPIDSSFDIETVQAAPLIGPARFRILLVEDMQDVRATLERRLRADGYDVVTAPSGDAALALVADLPPFHVVITDIVMPGALQGSDLARRLRATYPDIGVIYMSGHAHGVLSETEIVEAAEFLIKPISRAELHLALDRVLDPVGPAGAGAQDGKPDR